METVDQINKLKEFIDSKYLNKLKENLTKDKNYLEIDFNDLSKFNLELATMLLDEPEEIIKAVDIAIEEENSHIQVLFYNLPESTYLPLSRISNQLNKFLTFEGHVMKPSDIFLKCVSAKFECPSCLPKGTPVLTIDGYKPIEEAKIVISLDHSGNFIPIDAKIIQKGVKNIWKINNEINCSGDHKWFVYRDGSVQVIQTKDLNSKDILLRINDKMHNLWNEEPKYQEADMLRIMQEKELRSISNRGGENKNRQSKNNKIIQERSFNNSNCKHTRNESQIDQEKIDKIRREDTFFGRTKPDKREIWTYLEAWQEMWRERISEIGETQFELEMSNLWKIERQEKRIIGSPPRWQSLQQFDREPNGSLSIMPYKITSISQTTHAVEMYDLQVPLYNNFILHNGVVTHNCGNILNILMFGKEFKEPVKCGCGRKGKFRLIDREFIKFQRLEIQESLDYVPDKPKRLVKKKVFIPENLTRKDINEQLQPGQKVRIHGFLDLEEIKVRGSQGKSNEFRTNIIANNLIPIESSWESIILNKKQIEKIKIMSQKKELLEEFSQSLAPTFEGYEILRKSLILQHVEGKRIYDENGQLEERGIILILLSGAPGTGKSYLMKKSLAISPLKNWTTGKGLTKVGLVACIVRDEYGSFTLEVGPLIMSDKGILGIDEMEKMEKADYGMLNNAMAEEKTKITKANIDQELRARTNILATSNPLHKKFVGEEPIINQLSPIPRDILDRFDVIWAMREEIDQDRLGDKYMDRHLQSEGVSQIWTNTEMQNYIAYARQLNPMLTREKAKYFNTKFASLTGKKKDETEQSHRLRGNILRWTYAHAKFHGIGKEDKNNNFEVSEKSIDFAFQLIRTSFEHLDLLDKEGFAQYEDIEDIPKKKEVNKFYVVKNCLKELAKDVTYKNVVPFDILKERINKEQEMDEDNIYIELEKLKRNGDIFEPRNAHYSII